MPVTSHRCPSPGSRWFRAAVLVGLFVACGAGRPLVERLEGGDWRPVPFEVVSMGGQRAAAQITFVLTLAGDPGRHLVVEGTVEIDPQATLVDGRWIEENRARNRSGVVSSATVEFFGGQGGRPSLGGRFTLSDGDDAVYRIHLPATELGVARPSGRPDGRPTRGL